MTQGRQRLFPAPTRRYAALVAGYRSVFSSWNHLLMGVMLLSIQLLRDFFQHQSPSRGRPDLPQKRHGRKSAAGIKGVRRSTRKRALTPSSIDSPPRILQSRVNNNLGEMRASQIDKKSAGAKCPSANLQIRSRSPSGRLAATQLLHRRPIGDLGITLPPCHRTTVRTRRLAIDEYFRWS